MSKRSIILIMVETEKSKIKAHLVSARVDSLSQEGALIHLHAAAKEAKMVTKPLHEVVPS